MALTRQSVVPRARLRQVQLGLGLGLEAGWLFAWSAVLGDALAAGEATPLIGLPVLAALLVAATMATRLAASRAGEDGRARLAVSILGVMVALWLGATALLGAGWPTEWAAFWHLVRSSGNGLRAIITSGLTLLVWWRGIVAGRARPSLDTAEGALRLAFGALALLFVLQVFVPRDPEVQASLIGAVLLVVSTGLLGLPLAAVQDQRERARYAGSPSPEIDGSWFGLLFGGVGALLLVALLLAQSLSFERLDLVLVPLGQLLGMLAWFVLYPLALAIGYLIVGVIWLLRLVIRPSEPHEMPRFTEMDWLKELREQADQPDQAAGAFLPTLGLIVGVLLAVWLLARAARRLQEWRLPDDVEEVRDSVWSWELRRAELLERLRARFQRPSQLVAIAPLDQADETPAGNVRQLYRRLLRLGIRRGRRRAVAETPDEYERALTAAGLFSAGQAELRLLTELYTQVRYGIDQPGPAALAAARAALEQLEAVERPAQSG
jgi:hypothetical protein